MFLRASKVEAEEAGESTEGMANSVSELREQLLALTNGRVDILADSGQYKSTYEILKDIASVWDDLVKNQGTDSAAILELIGGKRNANVVAAILENFKIAEEALGVATRSSGSALAENEKHLESITGKISQFQSAWQALSTTIVNSTLVKVIVDFGTALISAIDSTAKFVGSLGVMLAIVPSVFAAYNKFEKVRRFFDGLKITFTNLVGGAKRCPFEYAHYTVMVTLNESQMRQGGV
jgi:TP901 family phage tail tape measure protein